MRLLYRDRAVEVGENTTFLALAKQRQGDYAAPVILASVDRKIVELNKKVLPACAGRRTAVLSFITVAESDGRRAYERGVTMLFLRTVASLFGKRVGAVKLEYAIGDALFFSVRPDADGKPGLDPEQIERIRAAMRRSVERNEPFKKEKLPTEEAVALFRRHGMKDKERLFRFRRSSSTNVYRLGNFVDYYYGYMPPSTGYLTRFDLCPAEGGVLLVLPPHRAWDRPGDPRVPARLFATMRRTAEWGERIGVPTVAALNEAICRGEGRDIILASEAYQEHLIGEIARRVRDEGRRVVLIAGPSSSGKTSFSHRLAVQLGNVGLRSHPIACDNYYVDRSRTPRDENGNLDFERLDALDLDLLNRQMAALLRGERVELPTFNFRTGLSEFNGNSLRVGADDVLVIEGIHGLNDQLTREIRREDKFKIYISALTALNVDEHNRVSTTDNREIRRMVRDARTRGVSAAETISLWPSVRRGEERHIFPFQESADVMFNSASLYELSVLKTFAEPLLFAIPPNAPEYPEAKRLLKFLEYFLGLSCEDVPRNSLIREFIGGSAFPVG